MSSSYFITGASGQQGGATCRALLSEGAVVHALMRDLMSEASLTLKSQGAKIFKGDMLDIDSLKPALVGVTGVFLNTFGLPPNPYVPDTQIQQAENVIAAALQTGTVTTLVVSTVICTNRHLEWATENANYPLASYYGTKHAVEELPELETKHELAVSYAPSTKLGHLSAGDVGKFAAAALLNQQKFHGQEIDLVSENLTIGEVAEKLSVASGVKIKTRFRSVEETLGIDYTAVPGITYQGYMMKLPLVYEGDLTIAEKYGIGLTTFAEYLSEENTKIELHKTLGVI